ncbi:transmembrane protein 150C-like [Anabas testudineus]|uniref:CWH43-like N-terminal domain-containing protein n=1 Tax=Anabas testudineus TaxID=64144 RepID=A0A3Q1HN62_ANATE|nr:transmembrane protein 150C-like [Anabas testudineus]XP_026210987.1 transmembrane protein 150C-like [Anabas testudineus]
MMWNCSPWVLLPPIYSTFTAVGLWLVYFVAIEDKKIEPLTSQNRTRDGSSYFPFISIAGNFPPASCIFSEVMNLAAFVGFIIAVLRYFQLKHRIDNPFLNTSSLVAFSVGCLGMTLVGNFQLFTQERIHNLGTSMAFGLGTMFCWVQSYITMKVNLRNEGMKVAIVRVLLSGCITVCMMLYPFLLSQDISMPAARCQWALVMFFLIFLGTFAIEFRHYRFDVICTENCACPVGTSETLSELSRSQSNQL